MLSDRIEAKWIDAFSETFGRCGVKPGDSAAILSETQSRQLNVHLAELALLRLGARPFHIVLPTPRNPHPVPIRSTRDVPITLHKESRCPSSVLPSSAVLPCASP